MRIPVTLAIAAVAFTSSAFADDSDDVKRTKALVAAMSRGVGAVEAARPLSRRRSSASTASTADCATKFPYDAKVAEADLPALLACLSALRLVRDGASLVGDPGYDIDPTFDVGMLVGLEGSSNIREERARRTSRPGERRADAAGKAAVAKKVVPFLAVEIYVCVSADGTVDKAAVNRINVPEAGAWSDAILREGEGRALPAVRHEGHGRSRMHIRRTSIRRRGARRGSRGSRSSPMPGASKAARSVAPRTACSAAGLRRRLLHRRRAFRLGSSKRIASRARR